MIKGKTPTELTDWLFNLEKNRIFHKNNPSVVYTKKIFENTFYFKDDPYNLDLIETICENPNSLIFKITRNPNYPYGIYFNKKLGGNIFNVPSS